MYKYILKSMAITGFAVLTALPAVAQIRADLGPVRIRIATEAPPRAKYERRTVRPDRDSVWINGYWHRDNDQWSWMSGRWDHRPDPKARWINARYTREGSAWRYEPARWSNQQVDEAPDYQQWKSQHPRGR